VWLIFVYFVERYSRNLFIFSIKKHNPIFKYLLARPIYVCTWITHPDCLMKERGLFPKYWYTRWIYLIQWIFANNNQIYKYISLSLSLSHSLTLSFSVHSIYFQSRLLLFTCSWYQKELPRYKHINCVNDISKILLFYFSFFFFFHLSKKHFEKGGGGS